MSATDIAYRDAREDDAEALAAFSARSFVDTFGTLYPRADLDAYLKASYEIEKTKREIADPDIHYRLALKRREIVGYCMTGKLGLPVTPTGPALELKRLYVDEDVKGLGVSQALMEDALIWCRGRAAAELYLSVWENNTRAQAFYRRYGFEEVGEHGFMVGATRDRDLIWRMML